MKWKELLTASLILILLSGCGGFGNVKPEEETADCDPVVAWKTFNCGQPPVRDKANFKPVKWVVEAGSGLWTLEPSMYANLGYNTTLLGTALFQFNKQVEFYQACIAVANSIAVKEN